MRPALRLPLVMGLLGTFLLAGSLAWAKVTVTPTDLPFGFVSVNGSKQLNITVMGVGGAASTKVKVTGASAPFSAAPTSFNVKKNHSKSITVTFSPTTPGTFSATIQVNGTSHPVTVQGIALTGPTPTPTTGGPTPTATLTVTATETPGESNNLRDGGENLYLPLFEKLL